MKINRRVSKTAVISQKWAFGDIVQNAAYSLDPLSQSSSYSCSTMANYSQLSLIHRRKLYPVAACDQLAHYFFSIGCLRTCQPSFTYSG